MFLLFYLALRQPYPDNRVLRTLVVILADEVIYLSLLKERPSRTHDVINANNKNNNDNICNNNINTVNILVNHLNSDGIHLNRKGTALLVKNYSSAIRNVFN